MSESTSQPSTAPTPTRSRRGCGCGSLVIGCLGVTALLAAAVMVALVVLWWLVTGEPEHWQAQRQRLLQLSEAERDEHAQRLENRLDRTFSGAGDAQPGVNVAAHDPSPLGERELSMSFDELNAWLDRRLELWLQHEQIDLDLPVSDVVVASSQGELILAARVGFQHFASVLSARIDAELLDDGDMRLHLRRIELGRLPMPLDQAVEMTREHLPERYQQQKFVRQSLEILEGERFTPAYDTGDHEVRLIDWLVRDDGVDLTITLQPTEDTDGN